VVEKRKEKIHIFCQLFLVDPDAVLDAHGLCVLPGWYTGHIFGQGACLGMFFSELKVGGVGTYLEHICVHLGGFFLEKVPVSCR
jgi:hypothetical protein